MAVRGGATQEAVVQEVVASVVEAMAVAGEVVAVMVTAGAQVVVVAYIN